jgi:hypothetical protein
MYFRNIKIIDYPGFNKIDLTFDNSSVLFITCEKYDHDLTLFSDFFMLFLMLVNPNTRDYVSKSLQEKATIISIDFNYKEKDYYYYLEISNKGVFLEELYAENNIIYQNNSFRNNPFLPEPVKNFFESLIVVDLTREGWLNILLDEAIQKCNNDFDYIEITTNLLKRFDLLHSDNDVRVTGDDVYVNGKSVSDSPYNIKVIFSLLPLIIDCIGSNSILFLHGFDIDIDMKSKINIVRLFMDKEINTFDSQVLFTDETKYSEYNLILKSENICEFSEDYNGNYVLKN